MTSGIDESSQAPPVSAAPSGSPPKGPMQRIIGALFSPNEAFEDIARRPDILVPLAIIVLVSLITTIMVMPKLDFEAEIREQIEGNKNMSVDDVDRAVKFAGASAKVVGYASPVFSIVILAILAGILLLAFRMMGGEGTYKQAFSVTLYSWFPLMIKGIITTIILMGRDSVTGMEMAGLLKSNPGFLVDPKAQAVTYAILSSLDIFNIWTMVLLIIGFAWVSRFTKAKSAAIIVTLWIVACVVKVGLAALGASKTKAT